MQNISIFCPSSLSDWDQDLVNSLQKKNKTKKHQNKALSFTKVSKTKGQRLNQSDLELMLTIYPKNWTQSPEWSGVIDHIPLRFSFFTSGGFYTKAHI